MSCCSVKCYTNQNENLLLNQIPKCLKNLSYGVYPNNKNYNDKRFIYNKLFNYYPLAIFYPNNENDVSYLIKQFIKYDVKFTIRCGGHAYEPASLSESYIIDVSKITRIDVNRKEKYVCVGSGVKLGNLINELKQYRLITPTGESSCVGLSGLVLAGGKGFLSRVIGMASDNIISLKIVNPEGNIITVDENNYSDLLWAFKGAGTCNFGVVTEFKIKLYNDIYSNLNTFTWDWKPDIIKQVLTVYQDWITKIPYYITTDINIMYNKGNATFTIKFYKFKREQLIEADVFKNIGNPTITSCKGYYSQITDCWVNLDKGLSQPFSKMKSIMIFDKNIEDDYLSIYTNSINTLLEKQYNIIFQYNFTQMGGKSKEGNGSYFPREALIALSIFCTWEENNLTDFCQSFTTEQYNNLVPYTSEYVFPNMIDFELDDFMTAYYGNNQDMLIDIKKKYDPNNIFNWKQSIPV